MKQSGVTLLEMLIAMFLLATIASVGLHQWQQYRQRQQLDLVSSQLVAHLTLLQAAANWQNRSYLLAMRTTSQGWLFTVSEHNNEPIAVRSLTLQTKEITQVEYAQLNPIIFYGRRSMASAGHIRIGNDLGSIRVVVSARGRIRRCAESGASGWGISGIPAC